MHLSYNIHQLVFEILAKRFSGYTAAFISGVVITHAQTDTVYTKKQKSTTQSFNIILTGQVLDSSNSNKMRSFVNSTSTLMVS